MSCPDWNTLATAREADPVVDPPGFAAALAHLSDCSGCRKAAARVDPLLLFSALGGEGAAAPSRPDQEMQNAVLAMVRASRVATREERPRAGSRAARIAAGILLAILVGLSGRPPAVDAGDPVGSAELGADPAPASTMAAELAVVMIVDSSLDV